MVQCERSFTSCHKRSTPSHGGIVITCIILTRDTKCQLLWKPCPVYTLIGGTELDRAADAVMNTSFPPISPTPALKVNRRSIQYAYPVWRLCLYALLEAYETSYGMNFMLFNDVLKRQWEAHHFCLGICHMNFQSVMLPLPLVPPVLWSAPGMLFFMKCTFIDTGAVHSGKWLATRPAMTANAHSLAEVVDVNSIPSSLVAIGLILVDVRQRGRLCSSKRWECFHDFPIQRAVPNLLANAIPFLGIHVGQYVMPYPCWKRLDGYWFCA